MNHLILISEEAVFTGGQDNTCLRIRKGMRAFLKQASKAGTKVYIVTEEDTSKACEAVKDFAFLRYVQEIVSLKGIEAVIGKEKNDRVIMIGCNQKEKVLAEKENIRFISLKDDDTAEGLGESVLGIKAETKGYFISLEGLDGCGKTTQADRIERALIEKGYSVRRSREPGGCPVSEKIRDMVLDINNKGMTGITEAMLYAASRAQHVHEVIAPAVADGEVVLCDRFVDSSVAFQGGGRQLGVQLIQQINAPAVGDHMPDTTVYLRLDHETSLRRRSNASKLDRIESEKAEFHARVEKGFDEIAANDPDRFIVVDASMPPDAVTEAILPELLKRIEEAEVT